MTDAIQAFSFTVPGGGGPDNIYFQDTSLGLATVEQIIIQFPPGTAGLFGMRIEFAVQPVYPIVQGQWFVADDYTFTIPVTNQGNSGQWRIAGYNGDTFQHTIRVLYYYNWVNADDAQSSSALVSL